MKTFPVAWVLKTLAAQEGLNVETVDIDDVCFGMVISSDKTFRQVAQENSAPYNYQIVDGDPIRLVRRLVNDDLVIDVEIDESECIRRDDGPAVSFSRIEPSALPRQVEIQYIDPDRNYAINSQTARHVSAPATNTQISIALDFVISAQQALDIAFDVLYRIWAQQLHIQFEHPDLRIEPGDSIRLTAQQHTFTCIVTDQSFNLPARTNDIKATILLSSKAASVVTAPTADPFVPNINDDWAAWVAAT